MKKAACIFGLVISMAGAGAQDDEGQSALLEAKVKNLSAMGEGFAAGAALANNSDGAAMQAIASDYREFSNNFSSVQSYLQNNQYDDATATLKRWLARTKNEGVKKALTDLLTAVQKEEKSRAAKLAKQTDEMLKQAAVDLAKAKTPDDVEEVQQALQEFRSNQLRSNSREIRKLMSRLDLANNAISYWQQVLRAEQRGDWNSALGALRSLRNDGRETSELISREVVMKRFEVDLAKALVEVPTSGGRNLEFNAVAEKALAGVIDGVKTPADAAAALQRLEVVQNFTYGVAGSKINLWRSQLANLARLQDLYENGSYSLLLGRGTDSMMSMPMMGYERNNVRDLRLGDLATTLQIKALAAVTGWKDLGEMKSGQSFADFLKATADQAFAAKDWSRLFEVLGYYSAVSNERYTRGGSAQDGVRALIAGQQLEKVGQFRDAARHYTACIAEVGPFAPIEAAAEALNRVRADHPEAFRPEVEIK